MLFRISVAFNLLHTVSNRLTRTLRSSQADQIVSTVRCNWSVRSPPDGRWHQSQGSLMHTAIHPFRGQYIFGSKLVRLPEGFLCKEFGSATLAYYQELPV